MSSRGCARKSQTLFLWGKVCRFEEKRWGLRPIAIGLTLRRISSKLVNCVASEKLAPFLSPLQVVVGVKGGMEAAVHAARLFLDKQLEEGKALLKVDFKNAFNSLRRDSILKAVNASIPE